MVILNETQKQVGYVSEPMQRYVAKKMRVPVSAVHGVVTFYSFFTTQPRGKHTVKFCMGTACYVKGADRLLAAVEQEAGIKAGETTADGQVSLLTARCIGACGIAPAVVYDGTVTPRQSPEDALARVKGWTHGSK